MKNLNKYSWIVLAGFVLFQACRKNNDGNPNPDPNPNPNPDTVTRVKIIGWWTSYKNGSMNTPSTNVGYPLLYFGPDSFYLQKFLGNFQPGMWTFDYDTININGAKSKVSFNGDTLIKFSNGIYSQYYFKKDSPLVVSNAPRISTIAGTGSTSFNGDGLAALATNINSPSGIVVDNAGNVYFTQTNHHRVRRLSAADGKITTIAGTGTAGFSGDGGPATAGVLNTPTFLAIDAAGNIFISDFSNSRIRKISVTDGKISTLAGTGTVGFSGDGGPSTAAQIRLPGGIAVDNAGNIFFADSYNHRIRKISANDGTISTIAGTGTAGFSGEGGAALSAALNQPAGIRIDNSGNIYIADNQNHRLRKISASDGKITTLAGNGSSTFGGDGSQAINSILNSPTDVIIDNAGDILIADQTNHRIRKITLNDGKINTVAGNGTTSFGDGIYATYYGLSYPTALAKNNAGNILVADKLHHRLRLLVPH